MDIKVRQTLDQFLKEVIDWGKEYSLEEGHVEERGGKIKFATRVVFIGEEAPSPTDYAYSPYSMLRDWANLEIVVPRTWQPNEPTFEFSEGVRDWYHQTRVLSDHEIRVMIGKKLYRRFTEGTQDTAFDAEGVAHESGLTSTKVINQALVLKELGYAEDKRPAGVWTEGSPLPKPTPANIFHRLRLTSKGHQWAASNYPPETMGQATSVTVTVDVHVAVSTVIEQSRQSQADDETKQQFELFMHRIEAELRKPKGEGSIQPVKDALEVANNAKGLLGPLVNFMSKNWDKIDQLSGMMF